MGDFEIAVHALGCHGCQRNIKDGGQVQNYCGSPSCPDCITREYLRSLKRAGVVVETAEFIHWPGTKTEVRDNLITGRRTGNF